MRLCKFVFPWLLVISVVAASCAQPPRPSPENKLEPPVLYSLYGRNLYKSQVAVSDYGFVSSRDALPKTLALGTNEFSVIAVDLEPNPGEKRFSVYVTLSQKGAQGKTGFWFSGGEYGGITTFVFEKQFEDPTPKQRDEGVSRVYRERAVGILAIDYDLSSGRWNWIQLGLLDYREEQRPPKLLGE